MPLRNIAKSPARSLEFYKRNMNKLDRLQISRYDWQLSNLGAAETPGRPSRTLLVDVNASLIACVPFRTPWGGFAAVPTLPPPILPRLKCRRGNNDAATHETKRKTFRITRFATISFSNMRSVNNISFRLPAVSGRPVVLIPPWKYQKSEGRSPEAPCFSLTSAQVLISKHHEAPFPWGLLNLHKVSFEKGWKRAGLPRLPLHTWYSM